MIDRVLGDIRFALRTLLKSPTFAAAVVATIGRDGWPVSVATWYGWLDGRVLLASAKLEGQATLPCDLAIDSKLKGTVKKSRIPPVC